VFFELNQDVVGRSINAMQHSATAFWGIGSRHQSTKPYHFPIAKKLVTFF